MLLPIIAYCFQTSRHYWSFMSVPLLQLKCLEALYLHCVGRSVSYFQSSNPKKKMLPDRTFYYYRSGLHPDGSVKLWPSALGETKWSRKLNQLLHVNRTLARKKIRNCEPLLYEIVHNLHVVTWHVFFWDYWMMFSYTIFVRFRVAFIMTSKIIPFLVLLMIY